MTLKARLLLVGMTLAIVALAAQNAAMRHDLAMIDRSYQSQLIAAEIALDRALETLLIVGEMDQPYARLAAKDYVAHGQVNQTPETVTIFEDGSFSGCLVGALCSTD